MFVKFNCLLTIHFRTDKFFHFGHDFNAKSGLKASMK